MTEFTLASIERGLQAPFAPEEVKYLPKAPRKKPSGEWVCLALPYADKRAYEDRLNDLAFGFWSTPYNAPYAVGNKLVVPVTVAICGVEHTDYGEANLVNVSRNGEQLESENSATVAYSQGFSRACAQFRLGRYFYSLPKIWVPYDPVTKALALTDEQKYRLTLRLYQKAGLLVPSTKELTTIEGATVSGGSQHTVSSTVATETDSLSPSQPGDASAKVVPSNVVVLSQPHKLNPGDPKTTPSHAVTCTQVVPEESAGSHLSLQEQKCRWLERQLKHNRQRIQHICEQYEVTSFTQLSEEQFTHLANRIYAAQKRAQQKKHTTPPKQIITSVSTEVAIQQ